MSLAHLERANEIRFAQASVKEELRSLPRPDAFRQAAELLLDPPVPVQRMQVGVLLTALPWVGWSVANELLRRAGIRNRYMTVGPEHRASRRALTARQRSELAAVLCRRVER